MRWTDVWINGINSINEYDGVNVTNGMYELLIRLFLVILFFSANSRDYQCVKDNIWFTEKEVLFTVITIILFACQWLFCYFVLF